MCLKDKAPCEIWTHASWVETSNANHYTNGTNKRCLNENFSNGFPHLKAFQMDFLIWRGSLVPWIISLYLRSKPSPVRHHGEWFFSFCGESFLKPRHQVNYGKEGFSKLNPIRKTLVPKHYIKIINYFHQRVLLK